MKKIKKALPLALAAALALSLCACEMPGRYNEYYLDVDGEGWIDCGQASMTAREDPDIDGDGEPNTPEEIVAAAKEADQANLKDPLYRKIPYRRLSFASRIVDGVVYTGFSYYFFPRISGDLMRESVRSWAHAYIENAENNGEDIDACDDGEIEETVDSIMEALSLDEPLYGASAVSEAGRVTLRIPTGELPQNAKPAPAAAAGEETGTPPVEHAPSFSYLIVRMPGPAETNVGAAEENVVTIDLFDPSQWEGLDEIVISAPVAGTQSVSLAALPPAVILPAAVLLILAAVWLLSRRKKRAAAASAPAAGTAEPAGQASVPAEELSRAEEIASIGEASDGDASIGEVSSAEEASGPDGEE